MIAFNFLRKHFIVCITFLLIIAGGCYITYYLLNDDNSNNDEKLFFVPENTSEVIKPNDIPNDPIIQYFVDIKGQVNNPGVYELSEGKRVIDVINAAGGLTINADVSVTNLSRKIFDEMVIIIYSKTEVKNFVNVTKTQNIVQKECIVHIENIMNGSCIENNNDDDGLIKEAKISLNNATSTELMELPGIGESKAKAIIDYREENNGFKSIDDLKNVSGIGEATFEKLKDLITL